jgi:glycosyltransferase involved in cell wall biosynthesis
LVQEGLVEWWGWKSDMRAVYQESALVVLPSMGEGLPTALIEACSSGRAIVTTDVPGCRDVVQNGVNGLLVPANDPEALSRAIITLLEDQELRERMGNAGRKIALEKFGDAFILDQNWGVYRKLLQV